MRLEKFFEKFELFAGEPDAVAKMRELVLELAVRGQLSERQAADQADSAWQTFINQFDTRNCRSNPCPPPFETPEQWRWVTVADAADCRAAAKVDSASLKDSDWVLDLEDIEGDAGKVVATATFAERRSLSTKASFQEGDVLYGKLRPYLNKVVIADRDGFCTTEIIPLRPQPFVAAGYFRFFLRSRTFLRYAAQKNYGMKMPRLGTNDLESAQVPLPPLAEQKRIVAKVDELMALCDRLEAQQQERETRHAALARASLARFAEAPTPDNLKLLFHPSYTIPPADLRKSILTLAVQGKLVSQDPNEESAQNLLTRLSKARLTLLAHGYPNRDEASSQLRKQNTQTLPDRLKTLAPGWAWATLIQASLLVVDCHNKTAPYVESGTRLLRTTNIRDGALNLSEPKFVDDATYDRWSARCKPEAGDVLITREAPMGEVCIIPEGMKVCLGQRMMLIRLLPETMNSKYLLYSLMDSALMERVQDKPVGATVQHLRVGGVETLLTPIPPLAEQRRIVAKVDELMALVDQMEAQLAAAKTMSAALLDAAIHELLNPRATILEFPVSKRDPLADREAVGCYVIRRMAGRRTFGRTAEMKLLYLAETHLGLPLGGVYLRKAAGPFDEWINRFEKDAGRQGWFEWREHATDRGGKKKIEYLPGPGLDAKASSAASVLTARQHAEFDRLLDLLADKTTEEAEIIATLFAAWNDLLIDGKVPSDKDIVREVRENWHRKKERFTPAKLNTWLAWLRCNDLVPRGRAPRTKHQALLPLHWVK